MKQLLDNQTADGSSSEDRLPGSMHQGHVLIVNGTFDGGQLDLEAKDPDGNWITVSGGRFTSPGIKSLDYIPLPVRATVSSAGASTDISVWAEAGGNRG